MKAKYAGKCWGCEQRFHVGDEIKNIDGRWYVADCKVCAHRNAAFEIVKSLEQRMMDKHHVLCGYDFYNQYPGYIETEKCSEFLRLAVQCGEASEHEAEEYRFWHGGRGMDRSLSE